MARNIIDTNSLDKPAPVEIPMHDSITDEEIMRVPSSEKMDAYAQDLAFAEEMVEFEVQTTSDPNAEPVITCGVNGVMRSFVRGVRYKDKRKFLEAVLSAKQRIVQTPEVRLADGRRVRLLKIEPRDGEVWLTMQTIAR